MVLRSKRPSASSASAARATPPTSSSIQTGHYRLTESSHGLVAVLNDLHKGRDTGTAWSVVIDVSAVLMTFISLTGLVLLLYLKRRRFRA